MRRAYIEILLHILARRLKKNFHRECAITPLSTGEKTKTQQCRTKHVLPTSGRVTNSISGILVGSLWFQTWVRCEMKSDLMGAWLAE